MDGSFALTLLQWFRENGRELPWRGTRDPYAIWLSEIILQQTQVKQGWDYWQRFMHRWPTVDQLAAATEDEVLREWQGLGYYSRARNLHFAARQIVAMGGFPTTFEDIRSLKGVGDYTAAAIGSIAFDLPVAVVDGNVYRVLSRHFGISTPINTTEGKKEFAQLAQEILSSLHHQPSTLHLSGLYNQAIMDFGAIQCTPSSPSCLSCPLVESCVAFREGRVGELPVKQKTLQVKERRLTYIYIRCQGQTAIHRRPAGDIWQGLYEPLLIEEQEARTEERGTRKEDRGRRNEERGVRTEERGRRNEEGEARTDVVCGAVCLRRNVKHVLTHRILLADFYLWEPAERPVLPSDYFWIDETDLDQYALPRLIEKLIASLPPSGIKKQ